MQFSIGILAGIMIGMIGSACVLANHQGMVNRAAALRMISCMEEKRDLEDGIRQYVAAVREVSNER